MTANELDCVDCHEVTLLAPRLPASYVGHAPAGAGARVANPYMLKSVAALGQYDVLCQSCHGSGASSNFKSTGVDIRLGVTVGGTPRHGDGTGGAQAIVEDDGTQLRTTAAGGGDQCRVCHDTHYSGKVKLFNDGHETHRVGASDVTDTAIVSSDCTTVCHYYGDANDGYLNRGHGMATSTYKYKGGVSDFTAGSDYVTMGMGCNSCHQILDTSDTSAGRKAHIERPTGGSIQQNYKARYNLSLSLQGTDLGSSFGNPVLGVCYFCHGAYIKHQGDAANTTSGCQDCHDEHAEGAGAGVNFFMIPQTSKPTGTYLTAPAKTRSGSEAVTYDSPRRNPATGAPTAIRASTSTARTTDGVVRQPGVPRSAERDDGGAVGADGGGDGDAQRRGAAGGGIGLRDLSRAQRRVRAGGARGGSCGNTVAGCHGTDAANAYPDGLPGMFPDRGGKHASTWRGSRR